METRKITVILESGNGTHVIETGAETLGELKQDFDANGINYFDKIIREGLSRTELIDDTSLLPRDVPFRGQITNNLVFTLTTKNKHIKSGGMTRAEAYESVKKAGLQEAVKCVFGKNFTQVSTSDLETFITNNAVAEAPAAPPRSEEIQADKSYNCKCSDIKRMLLSLIYILRENDALYDDDVVVELRRMMVSNIESPWSASDLTAITAGIR